MKGDGANTNLNTRKHYDSIVQRQKLKHYPNLNHVFTMLTHQPGVRSTIRQIIGNEYCISWIAHF